MGRMLFALRFSLARRLLGGCRPELSTSPTSQYLRFSR